MALYSDNLFSMRGAVLEAKPNASAEGVDRWINKRIREVVNGRDWSDLTRMVTVAIPNAITDGTISLTNNSKVVTGVGMFWAVSDEVNTTCPAAIRQAGYARVKPASMSGIAPGKWLLIDGGGAAAEAVAVEDSGANYFVASFKNAHNAGFTITKSSMAGRQLRAPWPLYTVTAVVNPATLWLDMPWGAANSASAAYQIIQAYVQPDPYCRRVKFAYDPLQGIALDTEQWTYEKIIAGDPQLTAIKDPQVMVSIPPGGGGSAQWLMYPLQASARAISMVVSLTWPKLVADEDRPPYFINPEVFVSGACSDALRTKNIARDGRVDPYYDLSASATYLDEFMRYLERAENEDEPRSQKMLQSWTDKATRIPASAVYQQSHPWPMNYGG